jgi:formate hydrogenlyase subunit 3/multisubunit Na+/H+ antiporter MnhD subunit
MIPTYELQRSTSFLNAIIALIGFIITFTAAIFATKYVRTSTRNDTDIQIERV